MNSTNGLRVLAIGLDAAEPTLIKQMIDEGSMPALAMLLKKGRWLSLKSTAYIGSASVWPTFVTGTLPLQHGIYSEWNWQPDDMQLERYHGRDLVPFWKRLDERGIPVGILDVPLTTTVGLNHGFEVSEWWSHDYVTGEPQIGGDGIETLLTKHPTHPLSLNLQESVHPADVSGLHTLTNSCIEGINLRGELAQRLINHSHPAFGLIIFPETHYAGHLMWHTARPDHPLFAGEDFYSREPLLRYVYQAVDKQITQLLESVGKDTVVMVLSLHGMKAALGFPSFLSQLLCAKGFSHVANWKTQSWSKRKHHLLATAKKMAPRHVRQLYYKLAPQSTIKQLAQPTMMPVYDWQRTRAFSSPSDQFGWIRINLEGREAEGSVPREEYEETVQELEAILRELKNEQGAPLVHNVIRTATNGHESRQHRIPDLIAHWTDEAFVPNLKIADVDLQPEVLGIRTGQHSLTGFCVIKGGPEKGLGSSLRAEEIGSLITRMVCLDR